MSDPKQPSYVPVVAGDLTDASTYSAPGEPWDGVPSIEIPSAGTVAAGFAPDQSWFGAQTLNGILQNYGMHIEALADQPTFEAHACGGDHPTGTAYTQSTSTSAFNTNAPDDPPLLVPVLAPADYEDSSPSATYTVPGILARTDNAWANDAGFARFRAAVTAGKAIWGADTAEYSAWDPGNTLAPAAIPEAEPGRGLVFGSDRGLNVLALGASRAVKLSVDGGHSFASATSLPTNANWHYPLAACAVGSQWIVIDQIDTTTTVNRLVVSDDLTATSWTVKGSSIGGPNSNYIRRITTDGSTIAVFLPSTNTNFGYWRPGDANVTSFRIGGIANDGTRTGWRGAWNAQIGRFLVGNAQGDLWLSSDGINWTQIANNAVGLAVYGICAHGRGFVVANGQGPVPAAAVDFIDFDRKFAWRRRNLLKARMPIVVSAFHVVSQGGRWYAGRVTKYSISGPSFGAGLEMYYSSVNPWDLNNG